MASGLTSAQSMSSSGGLAKTMVSRMASTPWAASCWPRSTPLPSDLDMALPPLMTCPWLSSRVNGSRDPARPQCDAVAQRLGHGLAAVDDLPLVEQPGERLAELGQAHVVQDLDEEPAVEQVQDGVLDAAHVQVDRGPAAQLPRGE